MDANESLIATQPGSIDYIVTDDPVTLYIESLPSQLSRRTMTQCLARITDILAGRSPAEDGDRKKAGEMRIRLSISVTDRSQITNFPVDTQILKGRTTWRNLPSIFLILDDFDYFPRFFSVSEKTYVILYLDALVVKVKQDGRIANRSIYRVPAVKNMAYICGTKGQTHPFPPKQVL